MPFINNKEKVVVRIMPFCLLAIVCSGFSAAFAQEPPPAKVVVKEIVKEEVSENRPFIGVLYYDRTSRVSSEVSGLVDLVSVEEGGHIKKDVVMIRLDTEMLEKEIDVKLVGIEQVELKIANAERNHKRLEQLYKEQGVSEKDYEDALYVYQDSVKEKQQEELELEKLLLAKEKSLIKAPYNGVILEKNVDTGDWVQQGKQLVRIGSINDLYVRVPVAENLLPFFKAGEKVTVMISAYGRELTGEIEDYGPVADAQTKNVILKVKIPVQDKVAENLSATVYVPVSEKKELSIIPRDALVKFKGQDFVYTVKEGKSAILPVNIVTYLGEKIGADNPYFVEGMVVVVEGNERLRPDQPVVVAGEK